MAYRSIADETTGYLPEKLMFGLSRTATARGPPDLKPSGENLSTNTPGFARELEERVKEVHH